MITNGKHTKNVFRTGAIQIELRDNVPVDVEYKENNPVAHQKMVISLTTTDLEHMYTREESKYIENMIRNFHHGWKSINLGAVNVSHFLTFCKNPRPLSDGYYLMKGRVLRLLLLLDNSQNILESSYTFVSGKDLCIVLQILKSLDVFQLPPSTPF